MENFDFGEPRYFTDDKLLAGFDVPIAVAREWPAELERIYDASMPEVASHLKWNGRSLFHRHHHAEVFAALFDKEKRAKLFDEGLAAATSSTPDPIIVDGPSIANEFKGFTADTFAFLTELAENNNKAWMHANKERLGASVREPMRHLFADVGPHLKPVFDRYLGPEALEITPDARHVLARINKNWSATADSKYYTWYWGAFYREELSKLTDAQLFANLQKDHFRFGFYIGDIADKIRRQFIERVQNDPDGFYDLVQELRLLE